MMDQDMEPNERRREMARKAAEVASEKMGDLWWTFLIRGIAFLILGLVALFWPSNSISLLLRIFGLFLIVDGALSFMSARRSEGQFTDTAPWLASAALGLVLLFLPGASVGLAFMLLGLWALVTGVGYLMTWWKMSEVDPERDTSRNIGIIALVAGAILVLWPGTGSVALGWTLAILAFVVSAIMFFLASRFKKVKDRLAR
ncbi:HdeD family acid-resistance protein [Sulfitobacter sp. SK012]|uniref:HdeD family acid-resistance protein n=1 Tax=Sulfitobacter sp. SK012 TaxID=1389005 RepID=UPI0013B43B36|nr:DUF308 domain-containing protein [Sulfitobacter sp. SK012]